MSKVMVNEVAGLENAMVKFPTGIEYQHGGAGSEVRSLGDKLRESVSVLDFGATGDGTTNDRPAFVLAIAHCIANDVPLYAPPPSVSYKIATDLDISCIFEAGVYNLFSGAGVVTFSGSGVVEVYPEWWGAVAVPHQNEASVLQTPNDCTSAIASAIRSIRFNWQPSGKVVKFGIGVYGLTSLQLTGNVLYGQGLTLRGTRSTKHSGASSVNIGAGGASVLQSMSSSAYLIELNGVLGYIAEVFFEDLAFDGNGQKDAVVSMAPGSGGPTQTANYIYFDRCVWHNVKDTKYFVSSNTSNVHSENALIYFNQCSFQLNSPLNGATTGISIFLQNPGAWGWQFNQCYFSGTATTNYASIYVQSGGIELNHCYFEANTHYDISCSDGGYVHAHDCHSDSDRFATFGSYGGGGNYTTTRGIIIENLKWKQSTVNGSATGTWGIISDATQNITIRNMSGGGVYLRSGSGNAFIENVVGGNIEFGNRSDPANTYTGTATLVNVPNFNTINSAVATPIAAVNILEGTDASNLKQYVAKDLLHYLSIFHVLGTESYYISSYKHGIGYKKLTIRASEFILDDTVLTAKTGSFTKTTAGDVLSITNGGGTPATLNFYSGTTSSIATGASGAGVSINFDATNNKLNVYTASAPRAVFSSFGLAITGDISVSTKTPSSASDTGATGTITWDTNYIYICTATNTWKRVAISSW